jgi:hypothetical protein
LTQSLRGLHPTETSMTTKHEKEIVRIDLSQPQKDEVKAKTGRDVEAIELTVTELEERITPGVIRNHNDTFLVD